MREAIFDTSAIVPSLLEHDCSEAVERVLKHFDPVLITFTRIEFANTLRNFYRARKLDQAGCREALKTLDEQYPLAPIDELVPAALDLAMAHQHSAYDCLYVAAAKARSIPLVTADKRLAAKFERHLDGNILNLYALPEDLT